MKNAFLIPLSIVVAGLLVAAAIFFANQGTSPTDDTTATVPTEIDVQPVTDEDFIRRPRDAAVTIIQTSDTECPFCKRFHDTMKQVRAAYPDTVAWVYRHFPIVSSHPKAQKEAEALECAGALGGNDAFWSYTDRLYEITPGNNGLDLAKLPEIAVEIGLDRAAFSECLDSGEMASNVEADLDDARRAAQAVPRVGTPYSIIVTEDETVPLVGAQPFETIKTTIDALLADEES